MGVRKKSAQNPIELCRMRVARSLRGTGLAQKLVQRAEEFAWSLGETRIELVTSVELQAAMKLYSRSGFKVSRIRDKYVGYVPGILWRFVDMYKERADQWTAGEILI